MDYLISFYLEELFYRCHIDTVKLRIGLIVLRYWAIVTGVVVVTTGIWSTMLYLGVTIQSSDLADSSVWNLICQLIGWASLVCGIKATRDLLIQKSTFLSHLPTNPTRKMWTRFGFNWFEPLVHCEFSHYDDSTIEEMPHHFHPSKCQRGEIYVLLNAHSDILLRIGDTELLHHPSQ